MGYDEQHDEGLTRDEHARINAIFNAMPEADRALFVRWTNLEMRNAAFQINELLLSVGILAPGQWLELEIALTEPGHPIPARHTRK